jgi:hypothetical protein
MPWYYVLESTGEANCLDLASPPNPEKYLAGPFPTQDDCLACRATGSCGGSSSSGSSTNPATVPAKRYLCKSLLQIKYGRDVWGLQCGKFRVMAKDVGVKYGRDYYVANGCGPLVHAKNMMQRRHGRDVFAYAEGCCDGSGSSASASASASQSASASASASASGSSASSGSVIPSDSVSSASSTSGSITSGSQTGITTPCCNIPFPRSVFATVSSTACPTHNGTYELIFRGEINNCLVWDNGVTTTPGGGCVTPPSISFGCCTDTDTGISVLVISFSLSSISICNRPPPLSCEEYTTRQCEPLLVQQQIIATGWVDDSPGAPPFTFCCGSSSLDFLITVTL